MGSAGIAYSGNWICTFVINHVIHIHQILCTSYAFLVFEPIFQLKLERSVGDITFSCSFFKIWNAASIVSSFSGCSCHRKPNPVELS